MWGTRSGWDIADVLSTAFAMVERQEYLEAWNRQAGRQCGRVVSMW